MGLVLMYATLVAFHHPAAALLFCVQGAALGTHPIVVRNLLNRRVPSSERRATILSIESMACRVAFGVVGLAAGLVLERVSIGASIGFVVAVAAIPLAVAALVPSRAR